MRTIIFRDKQEMGEAAAILFAAQVIKKTNSVLGFATGSSPLETYAALSRLSQRGIIDFSAVRTYNLDEYVGLPPVHEQSYAYFMRKNLFSGINIRPENCHLPDGMAGNLEVECASYERRIDADGGIDLQLLGIGHNGHIGFNEPGNIFPAATHRVTLTPETISANKRFFASIDDVPRRALSMGIGTIMKARGIVLLIHGVGKADICQRALQGPVTPQVPASILRYHPNVTVLLDQAAAAKLQ